MTPEELEAKRQEVREATAKCLYEVYGHALYGLDILPWDKLELHEQLTWLVDADVLSKVQSSLGVVLADPKGELPEVGSPDPKDPWSCGFIMGQQRYAQKIHEAGYRQTYELTEER
jgi:hypothetical protein